MLPLKQAMLDGGLLNGVSDVPGNAVMFWGRGWTFLSFWDRSGDSRPNSNSTFLFEGEYSFEEAVELAKEIFPTRWSIIKYPPKEYSVQ